jgi:hypothetical protein
MISKRSRKNFSPVENLKQSGFNGSKGIDVNASAEDTDRLLLTKNLDVDADGSLKLRKPVVIRKTLPEVVLNGVTIPSDVLHVAYMFDNIHVLIVRKASDGKQYIGIFEDKIFKTFQITINSWDSGTEHILEPYKNYTSNYIHLPYLDFSSLSLVNSSTSTILTGVRVNLVDSAFKVQGKSYSSADQTELFYPSLYDYMLDAWRYRTVTISKPEYIVSDFDVHILTPEVPTIDASEDMSLNANLDADNPYAIRDVYDTTAPTVKAIIPYVPSINKGNRVEYTPDLDADNTSLTRTENIPMQHTLNITPANNLNGVSYCQVVAGSGNTVESDTPYFDIEVKYVDDQYPGDAESSNFKIHVNQLLDISLSTHTYSYNNPNNSNRYRFYPMVLKAERAANEAAYFLATISNIEFLRLEVSNAGFLQKSYHRVYFTLEYSDIRNQSLIFPTSELSKQFTGALLSNALAGIFNSRSGIDLGIVYLTNPDGSLAKYTLHIVNNAGLWDTYITSLNFCLDLKILIDDNRFVELQEKIVNFKDNITLSSNSTANSVYDIILGFRS